MSHQPEYCHLPIKIEARKKNVAIYRELTGRHSIPLDSQYWTLANYQPANCDGSEIVQMKKIGLIKSDSQFFGVDFDEDVILKNKEWHPNANWIRGKWEEAIRFVNNFNPAFIYLDMTSFVSTKSVIHAINSTMHLCPKDTVMLVNLMLNDPRSRRKFDKSFVVTNLPEVVPPSELLKWKQRIDSFTYNATGITEMKTFIFFKERD